MINIDLVIHQTAYKKVLIHIYSFRTNFQVAGFVDTSHKLKEVKKLFKRFLNSNK